MGKLTGLTITVYGVLVLGLSLFCVCCTPTSLEQFCIDEVDSLEVTLDFNTTTATPTALPQPTITTGLVGVVAQYKDWDLFFYCTEPWIGGAMGNFTYVMRVGMRDNVTEMHVVGPLILAAEDADVIPRLPFKLVMWNYELVTHDWLVEMGKLQKVI